MVWKPRCKHRLKAKSQADYDSIAGSVALKSTLTLNTPALGVYSHQERGLIYLFQRVETNHVAMDRMLNGILVMLR